MHRSPSSPPPPPINRPRPTAAEWWSKLATDAWQRGQAATDPGDALRWLDRARRLAPHDGTVGLSVAGAYLQAGDAAAAASLFASIAGRWDVLEAWTGLAASALRLRDGTRAASAMAAALSRHAVPAAFYPLAAAVAEAARCPGWCAIDPAGALHAGALSEAAAADVSVDGVAVPARWRNGRCRIPRGARLEATRDSRALLGSPIDLAAIDACEGVVALSPAGDLVGWAWHPRNPLKPPAITVGGQTVTLHAAADAVLDHPLSQPRQLRVPAAALPAGRIHARGPDGRPLLGSPLGPVPTRQPPPARGIGQGRSALKPSPGGARAPRRIDVVVPIYRGVQTTLACLRAALASLPEGSRLHVVDDASPEPALTAAVAALAADPRVNLITLPENLGFPGAANSGLRAAAGRDVALLNSDALVPPDWLLSLGAALGSAPDIASACPLSNEATILSYPNPAGGNPPADPVPLSALARHANGAATVDIPVGVGFCMLLRRDCLDAVGLFREDVFAQGYGEENDWCLRARQRGWRHVAVPGCYVAHAGAASFGPARRHLMGRNSALLERLHPGYGRMIKQWVAADPLAAARRRLDAARWAQGRQASAVAIVTHDQGGGVERVVTARAAHWRAQGVRAIFIRPARGLAVVGDGDTPNLRYQLPEEWPALLQLLRADGVAGVELHHTLDHAPDILHLAERLHVPQQVFVHDYACFCPRIALVAGGAYCGEPDLAGCERCVALRGSLLPEQIQPAALLARSAALLAAAARVVVPSNDVARRMRRHFPQLRPDVTGWEDDRAIPPPPPTGSVGHVVTVGGIGTEKGFEVLLACVTDAARRKLPLRFTAVGTTADDERLLAAGPAFVTGRYSDDEVVALIQAQGADLALLPSVWPETWCFTLGHVWRAGLRAAVFDIGTPAERVRATGWGHVLPFGLPPASVNDWLLQFGGVKRRQTYV